MATPFVAGNWKMHTAIAEAGELAKALRRSLSDVGGVTRVVCPPFVSLAEVHSVLEGSGIGVGAQNMHPEANGAFTGEVSGTMLLGVCQYVILGHSERRHLFGEQDDFINRKLQAALGLGLTPILCVGETLEEREASQAEAVVERQLSLGLEGVAAEEVARVVIAYEPVWAIGTGRAATPEIAQDMIGYIRAQLARLTQPSIAQGVPILYGGSVNAKNAPDLAAQKDIDGALVGGASLQPDEFLSITKAFAVRG